MPDATAAAEPPLDPLVERPVSHGLRAGPNSTGSQAGAIPNLCYRSWSPLCGDHSTGWISANTWHANLSYVTGSHNLKVGYKIDALNAVMFVMVTFIATLIHIFSIGYMADETQTIVEDHQVPARTAT